MKAIIWTEYGPPEVLELREVEKPAPKENELLILIAATTVTAGDCEMRSLKFPIYLSLAMRLWRGLLKPRANSILGTELAGEVESVGKNVKLFKEGDQVFGSAGMSFGANAEYICLPEEPGEMEGGVALKPANMTYEEASTYPQAAILPLQSLRDKGQIQPGQKVLINGAGSGMGTFAVQIAKYYGAEVNGVDSTGKLDMLRSIGADHVIDYTQEDYTKNGQRYDLILDVVAYRSIFDYRRALSPEGIFLIVGGSLATFLQVVLLGALISKVGSKKLGLNAYEPNKREDLAFLTTLFEAGRVVPVIDRRYPLREVPEALRYLEEGHAQGKVVITVEHN